jgi:hypothetical protein
VDLERHLTQLVGVLLAVVSAEEKLEPAGQGDPNVRLSPAPIATIGSSQLGTFDDWCAHGVASLPHDQMIFVLMVGLAGAWLAPSPS